MTKKEDTRYFDERTKYKVKCKCGHSVLMHPKLERKICSWCGYYIYREQKVEFKDMLLRRLNA